MISFEIKRRRAVVEQSPPVEGTLFQQIAARRVQQQQQNPQIAPPVNLRGTPILDDHTILERTGIHPIGMGKIEYAKWLTAMVYPKFPRGSLVTLASQPFVVGKVPEIWFEVVDYQELHYCAQYDKETRQPKCLAIKHPGFKNAMAVYYPPAALRVLQSEEVQAIDRLRDTQSDGRNIPDARLDGTENSVDRSTGETS